MNPQDIRTLVDRLTLLEAGEPTNPSRRGFLKKAGAGVAVASAASLDPTGTIVKGLVKDLGLDNLSALNQLLKVATPDEVLGFFNYRLSSGIWEDAITDEEWRLAKKALPNGYDAVNSWVTDQFDNDKDGLEELSKLIGRPLTMNKIARVLEKNQIDYDDPDDGELNKLSDTLADLAYGKNNWINAQDAGKSHSQSTSSTNNNPIEPAQSTGTVSSPNGTTQPTSSAEPDQEAVKSNAIRTLVRSAFLMAKKLLNGKPGTLPTDLDPEAAINAKAAELASRLKAAVNQGIDSASSPLRDLIAALSNIASYGDKASEIIAKAERAVDSVDTKINTPALPPPSKSEYDDLLTPQVNKEKPEFDYWKPGEEDPKQLKKKNQ